MKKVLVLGIVFSFLFLGSATGALIDNGDGTVTDTVTGLMWQQITTETMPWKNALIYCDDLDLADYDDWRLPDRNELGTIVDYSRYNPAIDLSVFFETPPSGYWSSTVYADDANNAWRVHFYTGHINASYKLNSCYVRAVRGGYARRFEPGPIPEKNEPEAKFDIKERAHGQYFMSINMDVQTAEYLEDQDADVGAFVKGNTGGYLSGNPYIGYEWIPIHTIE